MGWAGYQANKPKLKVHVQNLSSKPIRQPLGQVAMEKKMMMKRPLMVVILRNREAIVGLCLNFGLDKYIYIYIYRIW